MLNLLQKYYDISIKKKLIALALTMLLYPILLVIFFGVYNNERIIKNRFINYVENNVLGAKMRIVNEIKDMERFFQDMLYNIDIYELFKTNPLGHQEQDSIAKYHFKRNMEKYLNSTIYTRQEFDYITVQFVKDPSVYYAAKETGFMALSDIPTDIFNKIDDNKVNYYFDQVDDKVYIYLVRPVYDVETFQKIATIAIKVSNEFLESMVGVTYQGQSETTYLYTQDGHRILAVGDQTNHQLIESNQVYLDTDGTYKRKIDGVDYYTIIETIDPIHVKMITTVSTDTLTSDTRQVTRLILLLCLVSIPIYILLANLLYRDIVSPFNILVSKMQRIEKGELNTLIPVERNNEIGYVYRSFNRMSKRLKYLVDCVYKEEITRKDAQIAALQAQINPHFLYNTLETINWKAQLSGQQDIAEMIQALSKLMDANMNRTGEKFIQVADEIDHMNHYMYLIQKRYHKKIIYDKQIDPSVLSVQLPKLIIQPLMENAINHGIEPIGRGRVSLHIYAQDEQLIICVEDDGNGMNAEKLSFIRHQLKEQQNQEDEKGGQSIGLVNVSRRLRLIYGNQAYVTIDSEENKGTKVTLILPLAMVEQKGG
ncbi:sensor histidine kinase [Vallitalea pronyensis]|uniref:histidine kinase n=1 Tax=Vallitalea pronyensis TaxID=1348613 RepID=A0A8J8MN19_9FIRM|nr:sensor histidine kinase [Vallitalea pronyensis]QUI24932.1 sensor histidine kinase [Vallitalea pronyensis]